MSERALQTGGAGTKQDAEQGRKQHQTLVEGQKLALRKWSGRSGDPIDDPERQRLYVAGHESVCFCLRGQAELLLEGSTLKLQPGSSWTVPANARHSYKILGDEPFEALEATHPPKP